MPAFPVTQPGHCAHLWLKEDNGKLTWMLGNDCGGLSSIGFLPNHLKFSLTITKVDMTV